MDSPIEPKSTTKATKKETSFFRELITFALLAIVVVLPIRLFVAQPFIVSGESMSPTFETGQYLIVDQISYKLDNPKRGDVVIFRFPNNPSKFFIKRIIGLPNETVRIDGNNVFITNETVTEMQLDQSFVTKNHKTYLTSTLESDEYFVMGDNRLASLDSRSWGPLPEEFLVGRALVRLLPASEIDLFPGAFDVTLSE